MLFVKSKKDRRALSSRKLVRSVLLDRDVAPKQVTESGEVSRQLAASHARLTTLVSPSLDIVNQTRFRAHLRT